MKPLLLLDVDGPLNPCDGTNKPRRRAGYRKHHLRPDGLKGRDLTVWLNPAHGPALLDLAAATGLELVWATTWNDEANRLIAPRIGLPHLPVIHVNYDAPGWKYLPVDAYAADRPLAWIDDDFALRPADRARFTAARASLPTLLHHVSPVTGITDADLDTIRTWAQSLTT